MTNDPNIKPPEPEETPNHASTERQGSQPILNAELKIPHSIIDKYNTEQIKKDRRERYRFYVEIFTVILIACYTTIAAIQGCIMKKATKAAEMSASAAVSATNIAKDTLAASKDTLNATINNFRLDQRAWVGPVQMINAQYLEGDKKIYVKEGQPIKGGIIIMNSGRTPARKLRSVVSMLTLKAGEKLVPKFEIKADNRAHSNVVMQPGTQLVLRPTLEGLHVKLPRILIGPTDVTIVENAEVSVKETIFSRADISNLTSGKNILYMFGLITYEDVFQQPRWTKFCMYLNPNLMTFTGCSKYNETDD